MELRYYVIMAAVVLVLQILIYNLSKTLNWLFAPSERSQKWLRWGSYLSINGLILAHFLGVFSGFRIIAFVLILLLFMLFISLPILLINWLFQRHHVNRRLNLGLRMAYPIAFFSLICLALYNAYTPTIVRYSIELNKPLTPLRIGVASDFHLGKYFGGKQLDKLAQIFEQEKVDLILLPGDIMDDNLNAYYAENMSIHLAKLTAPLGVFATLGNHDFFGSQGAIAEEIQRAGIQVLWDQAVDIDGKFAIIGRNDDLMQHRPTTAQLLQRLDTSRPIFLMDHRPTDIELHATLPIDMQVSGHTHKGQIFPANLITDLLYRLSYGYEQIGLGHYFVTSGYGFWGIPMRLGSQSEVLIIDVKGKE